MNKYSNLTLHEKQSKTINTKTTNLKSKHRQNVSSIVSLPDISSSKSMMTIDKLDSKKNKEIFFDSLDPYNLQSKKNVTPSMHNSLAVTSAKNSKVFSQSKKNGE